MSLFFKVHLLLAAFAIVPKVMPEMPTFYSNAAFSNLGGQIEVFQLVLGQLFSRCDGHLEMSMNRISGVT